MVAEMEPESES